MSPSTQTIRMAPSEVFSVPRKIRYLDPEQILLLEQAMIRWRDAAGPSGNQGSRQRMLLIFLLLRHTGARLGEILSLDEQIDFRDNYGIILLGKNTKREVPLPDLLARKISIVLQSPLTSGCSGTFFHADQGYVRRIFYARADECGLPRNLATPKILRNTRAVELLRSGVPLAVVRDILGQSSSDLAAVYQHYTRSDATSIVRNLALHKIQSRTSARNTFVGKVSGITRDGLMAEIILTTSSGVDICAIITVESLLNLGLQPGTPAAATIKAPHVHIRPPKSRSRTTARNCFSAVIDSIRTTDVLAELSGIMEDGTGVCALVSPRTLTEMNCRQGEKADFFFKGLSVVINTL